MMAPPTPCTARNQSRVIAVGASPQANEDSANSTMPPMNSCLRPSRSPSEPEVSWKAARVSA